MCWAVQVLGTQRLVKKKKKTCVYGTDSNTGDTLFPQAGHQSGFCQ
jgi:hypothetical protein